MLARAEELTESAFALKIGETSEVIEVSTGSSNGYFIIYRCEKSEENFNSCYDDIEDVYVQNRMGKSIDEIKTVLLANVSTTKTLNELDRSKISMD